MWQRFAAGTEGTACRRPLLKKKLRSW